MKLFEFFDKMKLFNRLVEQERTGTPDEFAKRLDISRSALYNVINDLRSREVVISYSRAKQTFYYENPVSLEIRFIINHLEELDQSEMKKIAGGMQKVYSVLFSGRKDFIFVNDDAFL